MVHSTLLFLNIGGSEMILILGVALLLFGGEKLPELARGLGKGIRDFKEASEDVKRELNNQINNFDDKKAEEKTAEPLALPEATNSVPNTLPVGESYAANDVIPHVEQAQALLPSDTHEHALVEVEHNDAVHPLAVEAPETDYNAVSHSDAGEHAKETTIK